MMRSREGVLLGPDTVSWRVNREPVVFLGGGRALLLQVAHPLVAAGVAQHSDYQRHPWKRLTRTLETTIKIVFGDRETSRRAADRLRRRHESVRGIADDGTPYDARDAALLLWVWATLIDTSVTLYERCFGSLSSADRETFYGEQKLFAHACGVPADGCPPRYDDFAAYFTDTVARDLRVTPAARAVREAVDGAVLPAWVRPILAPHRLLTAGLLPPTLRAAYGFAWGDRQQRLLDAWFMAISGGVRVVPPRLRALPVDLVASGRIGRR